MIHIDHLLCTILLFSLIQLNLSINLLFKITIYCTYLILQLSSYTELFLRDEDVENLHDFEEQCMDSNSNNKKEVTHNGNDNRIRLTNERFEYLAIKFV